jgi:spore germination cell wall hydrolase CwlJ-like protein
MKKIILTLLLSTVCLTAEDTFETELVAAVIILEAGGEGMEGCEAVWEVIHNRKKTNPRWPDTYLGVIIQPWQFSCLNTYKDRYHIPIAKAKKHPLYKQVRDMIIYLPKTNHTKNANHYCTLPTENKWTRKYKVIATVRNHKFYKFN